MKKTSVKLQELINEKLESAAVYLESMVDYSMGMEWPGHRKHLDRYMLIVSILMEAKQDIESIEESIENAKPEKLKSLTTSSRSY